MPIFCDGCDWIGCCTLNLLPEKVAACELTCVCRRWLEVGRSGMTSSSQRRFIQTTWATTPRWPLSKHLWQHSTLNTWIWCFCTTLPASAHYVPLSPREHGGTVGVLWRIQSEKAGYLPLVRYSMFISKACPLSNTTAGLCKAWSVEIPTHLR